MIHGIHVIFQFLWREVSTDQGTCAWLRMMKSSSSVWMLWQSNIGSRDRVFSSSGSNSTVSSMSEYGKWQCSLPCSHGVGLLVAGLGVPSESPVIGDDSLELSPFIESADSGALVTAPARWSSYFSVFQTVGTFVSSKPYFVAVGSAGLVNGFVGISITVKQ